MYSSDISRNIPKPKEMNNDKAKIFEESYEETRKKNRIDLGESERHLDKRFAEIGQKLAKQNQELINGLGENPLMTHKFEIDKTVEDLILFSDHEQQNAILFEMKRRLIESRLNKIQFNNDQSDKITKSIQNLQGIFNEKD